MTPSPRIARPERWRPYGFAWDAAKPVVRKRRARKPTLASVAKQASKAGIEVARYEVGPDKIIVVPGKPVEQSSTSTNEWDEVLPNGPASKIH